MLNQVQWSQGQLVVAQCWRSRAILPRRTPVPFKSRAAAACQRRRARSRSGRLAIWVALEPHPYRITPRRTVNVYSSYGGLRSAY